MVGILVDTRMYTPHSYHVLLILVLQLQSQRRMMIHPQHSLPRAGHADPTSLNVFLDDVIRKKGLALI